MEINSTNGLYVLKTHPYNENIQNVKISGNPDYTSPIINCFEKKKEKFDTETGKSLGIQIHGIYYDTKQGKFIKKLINENLINNLTFDLNKYHLLNEIKFENESNEAIEDIKEIENYIKEEILYKKVSLRSVAIELTKKKVNVSNSSGNLVETNHLDFLPPVMQIIGYRFFEEKKKFCEDTGFLRLELKCKWFNNISKSFSEEFLPYQCLILINEIKEESLKIAGIDKLINSNDLIQYPLLDKDIFSLEGHKNIQIYNDVIIPEKIIFNHYYHEVIGKGYIFQKDSRIHDISKIKIVQDNIFKGKTYPSYVNRKINIYDCPFTTDSYMFIKYKDQFDRITNRVIRISEILIYANDYKNFDNNEEYKISNINFIDKDFLSISSEKWIDIKNLKKKLLNDDNLSIIIKANCLLRKGEIRHFKLKSILNVIEIKDGKNIFEVSNLKNKSDL